MFVHVYVTSNPFWTMSRALPVWLRCQRWKGPYFLLSTQQCNSGCRLQIILGVDCLIRSRNLKCVFYSRDAWTFPDQPWMSSRGSRHSKANCSLKVTFQSLRLWNQPSSRWELTIVGSCWIHSQVLESDLHSMITMFTMVSSWVSIIAGYQHETPTRDRLQVLTRSLDLLQPQAQRAGWELVATIDQSLTQHQHVSTSPICDQPISLLWICFHFSWDEYHETIQFRESRKLFPGFIARIDGRPASPPKVLVVDVDIQQ